MTTNNVTTVGEASNDYPVTAAEKMAAHFSRYETARNELAELEAAKAEIIRRMSAEVQGMDQVLNPELKGVTPSNEKEAKKLALKRKKAFSKVVDGQTRVLTICKRDDLWFLRGLGNGKDEADELPAF